ncbi:chondroitin sulfate N-acetylgalactosaminyltransferase 2 [Macrosteles quadrilineatus]|uniref:chondroitin sulfate N-acetylgalactosaminyltransferase 2 n=1 Tax=Macrosteles quadrilineatus TaxID=74068 RepID=UPI0023E1D333|nr:chondroitin sulfate N-acetylgalactosaminyltransferase 2 [Macrosteles quadrilineatus]XP_054265245.1 chondroitin sulfate N-acetylgalactosaminyltransferase 2 [Macrosteles quadrilineatus]
MLRLLSMRLLTRVWLFAGGLSLVSLLIFGRCGIQDTPSVLGKSEPLSNTAAYISLLEQREEENRVEVARLTEEIRGLKLQLLHYQAQDLGFSYHMDSPLNGSDCSSHMRHQVEAAEVSQGVSLNNEYELVAFTHFTLNRVYPTDLGLGKRVVEKPIGFKRKDLLEAVNSALELLNRNTTLYGKPKYTTEDFLEGVYRTVPTTGTEYEMYFRTRQNKGQIYTKVSVMKPFAPLLTLNSNTLPQTREKELIHVILPLSGRIPTFQGFMDKFVKIALKNDRHVLLTVVYFGEDGLSEARMIMSKVAGKNGHANSLRLLALNETFSRAKGLRVGAERAWDQPGVLKDQQDVLLFLCDVDIVFSARFLDRCRWNSRPGVRVYYPVVFSLYNPHVVYTLQGKKVPSETDQLVISRDTGFWRDFGYGMTCQYKSDFLRVRGFDEEPVGWGLEDVLLYRKYIRSRIKVVRATDPGIFHIWHAKKCTGEQQSSDQYRACIRSRALNEASHAQLGFLAFREDKTTKVTGQSKINKKKRPSTSTLDKTMDVKTPTNMRKDAEKSTKKSKTNESNDGSRQNKDSRTKKQKDEKVKNRKPAESSKLVQTPLKEET